jgi:ribosome biogenesis protein SSF1/2
MGRTRRRKRRTHVDDTASAPTTSEEKPPLSIVIGRGRLSPAQQKLVLDVRRVMEPLTASRLKLRKNTSMTDILNVAGPLGVTQLICFTATELGTYMRIARLPRGPTLTFQVRDYTLASDLNVLQRRSSSSNSFEFQHSPLVVLSNFSAPAGVGEEAHRHVKLSGVMLQKLFPTIDVNTVKLADCRRLVLANYEGGGSSTIDWRHYSITTRQTGVSRPLRKLTERGGAMPDLSNLTDISELVGSGLGGDASDSEAEDALVDAGTHRAQLGQLLGVCLLPLDICKRVVVHVDCCFA